MWSQTGKEIEWKLKEQIENIQEPHLHNTHTHTHTHKSAATKLSKPQICRAGCWLECTPHLNSPSRPSFCSLHTDAWETFVREREQRDGREEGRPVYVWKTKKRQLTRQTDGGSEPAAAGWWICLLFFVIELTNLLQARPTRLSAQEPPSPPPLSVWRLRGSESQTHVYQAYDETIQNNTSSSPQISVQTLVFLHTSENDDCLEHVDTFYFRRLDNIKLSIKSKIPDMLTNMCWRVLVCLRFELSRVHVDLRNLTLMEIIKKWLTSSPSWWLKQMLKFFGPNP